MGIEATSRGLGYRQLAAALGAPEARAEDAAAVWKSAHRGPSFFSSPQRSAPPSVEQARLLLLAGIGASREDRLEPYPGSRFFEVLYGCAPVVTIKESVKESGGGHSRSYRVMVVEGVIALRLARRSARGVIVGKEPPGLHGEGAVPEVSHPYCRGQRMPLAILRSEKEALRRLPREDAVTVPAARRLAECLQRVIDGYDCTEDARGPESGAQAAESGSRERGVECIDGRLRVIPSDAAAAMTGCEDQAFAEHGHKHSLVPTGPRSKAASTPVVAAPPGASLSRANLTGARATRAALAGLDLRETFLENARLDTSDMRAVDFSGARLVDAIVEGCDLRGASIEGEDTRLGGSKIICSRLDGARMRGLGLRDVILTRCGLRDADLRDTDWRGGTHFYLLDMRGADLAGADMRGVALNGCDLRRVHGVASVKWEGCDLRNSKLDSETKVLAALMGARIDEAAH